MNKPIDLFAPTISITDCLTNSLREQDTVFMGKDPNADHIVFFHHISKLGGTRTAPTEKHFVLVGMDSVAYAA